uniref:Secreted protein n=1 Tax=Meloidogyne incognita TaxID=6306 RepID=A0A914M0P8_MELIC
MILRRRIISFISFSIFIQRRPSRNRQIKYHTLCIYQWLIGGCIEMFVDVVAGNTALTEIVESREDPVVEECC